MRFAISLCLFFILSGCASTKANYYTKTVYTWRGSDIKALLTTWGKPKQQVTTLTGNTVYIYKQRGYKEGKLTVICVTAFEANPQGLIVDTHIQGNGCFADEEFVKRRAAVAVVKSPGQVVT